MDKIAPFKKNESKLNKNKEYRNQIEYKILTNVACCWVDIWTFVNKNHEM